MNSKQILISIFFFNQYFDPSQGYRVPKQDPQSLPGQQNPQNLQQQQQQQQQQNAQPYSTNFINLISF